LCINTIYLHYNNTFHVITLTTRWTDERLEKVTLPQFSVAILKDCEINKWNLRKWRENVSVSFADMRRRSSGFRWVQLVRGRAMYRHGVGPQVWTSQEKVSTSVRQQPSDTHVCRVRDASQTGYTHRSAILWIS